MAEKTSNEEILVAAIRVKINLTRRYFKIHIVLGISVIIAATIFLSPVWEAATNSDRFLPSLAAKAGAGILPGATLLYLGRQLWALYKVIGDGHRFIELVTHAYRSQSGGLQPLIDAKVMNWIGS